jgi:beta-barrel assembly-enhancing protease
MMKTTLMVSAFLLLFVTGCKELKLSEIDFNNITAEDIQKGISFGQRVYDASKDLTPEQEYYIGRSVAASVLAKYKVYDNKGLNNYINTVGTLLTLNSEKPEIFGGYHFAVLDSSEVNAFATPGGFIFITKGMLKLCKNEDELAAVLAHEISHVQLRHGISSIKDSRWTAIGTLLATSATKKYGTQELASLTESFEDSIGDIVNTLVVNGYSREYEMQADQYALNILNKTGYVDFSMVSMLNTMQSVLKNDKRGFGATHPQASERIESINSLIKQPSAVVNKTRTKRFQLYYKYV